MTIGHVSGEIIAAHIPRPRGLGKPLVQALGMAGALALLLAGTAWAGYRLWPRHLHVRTTPMIPVCARFGTRTVVTLPGRFLVAQIATYDDEFFAYLMFTYLRGSPFLADKEVLLTYKTAGNRLVYFIQVHWPNDLLSLSGLFDAEARGWIRTPEWRFVTGGALDRMRHETRLFSTAYNLPARRRLEDMSRDELVAYIRRFVRFKSLTDPRIRQRMEPPSHVLTSQEANRLAQDIVTVSAFFSLPIDFFLGIGAMENNYMNIEGDLRHAIWKRRAEPGDVVLKRRPGRVLVVNSSVGVWQITRETLRYAHSLYVKDRRDYSLLPEHLRPPEILDVTHVAPATLTTYAGLLFRDLLDRCGGDVVKAVGAYNGGLAKPNPQYAAGAQTVAEYARRVLERAAVLNGPAAGRHFLSAGR